LADEAHRGERHPKGLAGMRARSRRRFCGPDAVKSASKKPHEIRGDWMMLVNTRERRFRNLRGDDAEECHGADINVRGVFVATQGGAEEHEDGGRIITDRFGRG